MTTRLCHTILCFAALLIQTDSRCIQDSYGGQCVAYVRAYFGGDKSKMPPLSHVSRDLGAYNAYGYWNLGYGYGNIPQSRSIFVQARSRYSPLGHMGVVTKSIRQEDGKYVLLVNDSNWGNDERVDCGRKLVYDPLTRLAQRDQGSPRYILGFIYSRNGDHAGEATNDSFFGGLTGAPVISHPNRFISGLKANLTFEGLDRSSIGLEKVPILYRSAKGYAMDAATRAKVYGLQTYGQMKNRGRDGLELVITQSKETSSRARLRISEFSKKTMNRVGQSLKRKLVR